jgi:lipoate---protein ligase
MAAYLQLIRFANSFIMLCIAHSSTDPYFNLAAEEYVLKNFAENCFMLWQNENTVVVGKHQNTLAEINMDYIREKNIRVVRRLSGGGAVYHDMGNLNFTFIMNGREGHLVDFKKYTLPVIQVLKKLHVDASFQGKNNLTIKGKKFSGNAEHIYRKRVLHHGTILFSSLTEDLQHALKVNPLKYESKAVKSIRSRVTNVKEHLSQDIDLYRFREMIIEHVLKLFPGSRQYEFSEYDLKNITELRNKKYVTWEWNFGYSPDYVLEKSFMTSNDLVRISMKVSNGIIQKIKIYADSISKTDVAAAEGILAGVRHDEQDIINKLKSQPLPGFLKQITVEEFTRNLF